MQHSPSVPWRALRAALGLGAAAVASLALAGVASAAVIPITPDGFGSTSTDNLGNAIATANGNSSSSNTIVMAPGIYNPGTLVTLPITITKNLTIVTDHTYQTPNGTNATQEINGGNGQAKTNNLFLVNAGVSLTISGTNLDGGGASQFAAVKVAGTLKMQGVTMDGSPGYDVDVMGGGNAVLTDTTSYSNLADAYLVETNGSLTMNNSTVYQPNNHAFDLQPPDTLNLNNTFLAQSQSGLGLCTPAKTAGGGATNGGPGSLDDDGTCGVQYSHNTAADGPTFQGLFDNGNGGPATTILWPTGNTVTTNKGVSPCPATDARFFANPGPIASRQCDIGATTNAATQETTGPSCSISNNIIGPPKQQQVTLADSMTGVGPQPGPDTDNLSNTPATAYPPPAAGPVPGYSVSNAQINNGTIAQPTDTSPSGSEVLTATKTTAGTTTQWSFTGMNWAGIATNCF